MARSIEVDPRQRLTGIFDVDAARGWSQRGTLIRVPKACRSLSLGLDAQLKAGGFLGKMQIPIAGHRGTLSVKRKSNERGEVSHLHLSERRRLIFLAHSVFGYCRLSIERYDRELCVQGVKC
jgi:hypothetical protein